MGFTLLFDARHRVLMARFDGHVTDKTVTAMIAGARAFADGHGACSAIADFTAVERFDLDSEFIRGFAQARPVMTGQKRLLVAPSDAIFGSLRMFELHQSARGEEPTVVRSLARAYEVLGISEPGFRPITTA